MMDYQSRIYKQLRENNLQMADSYGLLMKAYEEMFDTVVLLKIKQGKFLRMHSDSLKDQHACALSPQIAVSALEKKISEMQAELTDLYKRKSENAQGLIDVNRKLDAKEIEQISLKRTLEDSEERACLLLKTSSALKDKISMLEQTNDLLKDEHLVLQTSFTLLENKFKELQEENQKICCRLLEMKLKEADVMNMENQWQQKLREINLQSQLADATNEQIQATSHQLPSTSFSIVQAKEADEVTLKHHASMPYGKSMASSLPLRCKCKIEAHEGEVNAVKWSPSGKYLATGGADRRIKLWNFNDDKAHCSAKLDGCNLAVTCLDFDPDEAYVACGSNDFAVRLWSLATLRSLLVFNGHSNKVHAAKFAGSTGRLVSGSHDRTLKVWDMRTRCCFKTLFAASICNDLVTNSQGGPGANVISAHYDKKMRFWDIRYDKPVNEILFTGKISSLDLSIDGNYVLCCTRDDFLHDFDLRMNRVIKTYSHENFKSGLDYMRCCYSPDRQFCTAGSSEGSVFIWNVESGVVEACLEKQHQTTVVATAWHPNGQEVASCDKHKMLCIWS